MDTVTNKDLSICFPVSHYERLLPTFLISPADEWDTLIIPLHPLYCHLNNEIAL